MARIIVSSRETVNKNVWQKIADYFFRRDGYLPIRAPVALPRVRRFSYTRQTSLRVREREYGLRTDEGVAVLRTTTMRAHDA